MSVYISGDAAEAFNRIQHSLPTAAMNRNTLQFTPLANTLYHPYLGISSVSENVETETDRSEMRSVRCFHCSFCGERVSRNLRTSDVDQKRPIAFYCSQLCSSKGREYGFTLLDLSNIRKANMLYVDMNYEVPEISAHLNLSPQAIRTVLSKQIETRRALKEKNSFVYLTSKR